MNKNSLRRVRFPSNAITGGPTVNHLGTEGTDVFGVGTRVPTRALRPGTSFGLAQCDKLLQCCVGARERTREVEQTP